MKFVVCASREDFGDFSAADLTPGRLYEVIDVDDTHGLIRVIDNSGESYLYPASLFESVEVSTAAASRLHHILTPA